MRPDRAILAALALAAAACTPVEMRDAPTGRCDAAAVQDAVGTPGTTAALEGVRRRSGAKVLRVLRPGEMATMDYRDDRVQVTVAADGRIAAIRCG